MSLFGAAVSPFDADEWEAATGIKLDLTMIFEAWSLQRSLAPTFTRAVSLGHTSFALTWEPWQPVPVGTSPEEQGRWQPTWSNESIVAGNHDAYIDQFARDARSFNGTVYLRWGHEMNGIWSPWHWDAESYVAAWKYLRNRIRSLRNAWNVKMVWAPNPDLWRTSPADWLAKLLPYWPGSAAVDYLGFSMINFGGDRDYTVARFAERFDLSRRIFQKPVLAPEMNVAREVAVPWLADLAAYVSNGTRPLPVVVLSQGDSRAAAVDDCGDLSWSVTSDREGCEAVRRLVDALHST